MRIEWMVASAKGSTPWNAATGSTYAAVQLLGHNDEVSVTSADRKVVTTYRRLLELSETPWKMVDTVHHLSVEYGRFFTRRHQHRVLTYQRQAGPFTAIVREDSSWDVTVTYALKTVCAGSWFARNPGEPLRDYMIRFREDIDRRYLRDGTALRRWASYEDIDLRMYEREIIV